MPKNFPRWRRPRSTSRVLALTAVLLGVAVFVLQQEGQAPHKDTPRVSYEPLVTHEAPVPLRARVTSGKHAIVIDGDSLRVGDREIRLDGIDAPELRQTCRNSDGREWPCGRVARARLAELVSGREVICAEQGLDRYGRALAICAAGDVRDLGEALVRAGYALNYDRYTDRYRAVQEHARSVRRGVWSGSFEPPEDWRANDRRRETVGWSGR